MMVFFGGDPYLEHQIFPTLLRDLLVAFLSNGPPTLFFLILFHCRSNVAIDKNAGVELHQAIRKTMKKEEMLSKINKNYKGQQETIEDLEERIRVLGKTRIPLAILIAIGHVFMVIYVI
jgi:hypothetical protein